MDSGRAMFMVSIGGPSFSIILPFLAVIVSSLPMMWVRAWIGDMPPRVTPWAVLRRPVGPGIGRRDNRRGSPGILPGLGSVSLSGRNNRVGRDSRPPGILPGLCSAGPLGRSPGERPMLVAV